MTHQCVKIENLGEIADLQPDTPERREIEACPNCRALFHSYLAFLDAEPATRSHPQRADDDLAAFLRERVGGATRRDGGTVHPGGSFFFGAQWTRLWPRLAPVAAAVVLVVAIAVWSPWQEAGPVLERGDATSPLALGEAIVAGGTIDFVWAPHPGATDYVVVLFGADFSEQMRLAPVSQPDATMSLTDIPEAAGPRLAWRVLALENGDVIATSEPGYITLP